MKAETINATKQNPSPQNPSIHLDANLSHHLFCVSSNMVYINKKKYYKYRLRLSSFIKQLNETTVYFDISFYAESKTIDKISVHVENYKITIDENGVKYQYRVSLKEEINYVKDRMFLNSDMKIAIIKSLIDRFTANKSPNDKNVIKVYPRYIDLETEELLEFQNETITYSNILYVHEKKSVFGEPYHTNKNLFDKKSKYYINSEQIYDKMAWYILGNVISVIYDSNSTEPLGIEISSKPKRATRTMFQLITNWITGFVLQKFKTGSPRWAWKFLSIFVQDDHPGLRKNASKEDVSNLKKVAAETIRGIVMIVQTTNVTIFWGDAGYCKNSRKVSMRDEWSKAPPCNESHVAQCYAENHCKISNISCVSELNETSDETNSNMSHVKRVPAYFTSLWKSVFDPNKQ